MKRMTGINTGDARDFDIFFTCPNKQLSERLTQLAMFGNLSIEGKCLVAAVAERLAIQQPRESITYEGDIIHATFGAELLRRAHPSVIARFLQTQTPDKDILFYQKFFEKVSPVFDNIDTFHMENDTVVHMEVKADFSDWRLIIESEQDRPQLVYSNGFQMQFVIQSSCRGGSQKLPPDTRVYLPYWNTNEFYRYVTYDLTEGSLEIDMHQFDHEPVKAPNGGARPANRKLFQLKVLENKLIKGAFDDGTFNSRSTSWR